MSVAYFVRRSGESCSVIKLLADDREEIVQNGLTVIEAEILCAMKIADLPKPAAVPASETPEDIGRAPKGASGRQLNLDL